MSVTTVATLIMSIVGRIARPLSVWPNIEDNNRHAAVKSAARKKTHVTFTRKNVKSANKKLFTELFFVSAAPIDAWTIIGVSIAETGGFGLLAIFSRINFSTHRYVP